MRMRVWLTIVVVAGNPRPRYLFGRWMGRWMGREDEMFFVCPTQQVWQSKDNNCVLAICPRTCLWIVFKNKMAWYHVHDAILFQISPEIHSSEIQLMCDGSTDERTDGHSLLYRCENSSKIVEKYWVLEVWWYSPSFKWNRLDFGNVAQYSIFGEWKIYQFISN